MWWLGIGLLVAWLGLYLIAHQRGWVHLLLLSGISILLIQVMAYRKTRYQEKVSKRNTSAK